MHLGQVARRGSALALCTAGALALGVGSASASALAPASQAATTSAGQVYRADWNYCDETIAMIGTTVAMGTVGETARAGMRPTTAGYTTAGMVISGTAGEPAAMSLG
jgi:hypothetical protein